MKTSSILLRAATLLALALSFVPAQAAEKKVAGPYGGRLITTVEPRAEFFVLPDRKVQITFLDAAGKPVAPAEQAVTVTAGDRSAPKTLAFAKSGNALVSTTPLPAGDAIPAVVQIKPMAGGITITEKFHIDLAQCGECKLAEYACICGH